MKAVEAAFNQEKALVGAFSVITNLRMELFEALSNCCCQAALLELEFLKEVDQCGYLYERQHIHRAIYR